MFRILKRIVSRLFGPRSFGAPPSGPHDPHAGVREPRRRGPSGRISSVEVLEPKDDELVQVVGRIAGNAQGRQTHAVGTKANSRLTGVSGLLRQERAARLQTAGSRNSQEKSILTYTWE